MNAKSFHKIVTLALLILFFSLQALAAEQKILRLDGPLMEINLKKNMMVVNEKTFVWDKKTIFLNESGIPITADQLKVDQKVYIEGERIGKKRPILIKEIHLLPR